MGAALTDCCAVVELRQYTLKPGQRDALIDLFERHFIEPQEAAGMTLVGQFRDRRRGDRFVWIRGFANMDSRHQALETFYRGPVWVAHRNAANSTMLDTDDVLLLKPARPDLTFRLDSASGGTRRRDRGVVTVLAGVYQMPEPVEAHTVAQFERSIVPVLRGDGLSLEGVFVTTVGQHVRQAAVGKASTCSCGLNCRERFVLAVSRRTPRQPIGLNKQPVTLLELEPTPRSRLGDGPKAARHETHFDFLSGSYIHNRYLLGALALD